MCFLVTHTFYDVVLGGSHVEDVAWTALRSHPKVPS